LGFPSQGPGCAEGAGAGFRCPPLAGRGSVISAMAEAPTPAPRAPEATGEESRGAVLAAMAANLAIACGKLVAGALTGSAAMFAEAGHSVADTVNQVFLLLGINLSQTKADKAHPHGHGKEAFFWSFLAAIFIFVAGAAFSFFEGTRTLIQEEAHERSSFDLTVAFGVLGMAFLFESFSFTVAMRSLMSAPGAAAGASSATSGNRQISQRRPSSSRTARLSPAYFSPPEGSRFRRPPKARFGTASPPSASALYWRP